MSSVFQSRPHAGINPMRLQTLDLSRMGEWYEVICFPDLTPDGTMNPTLAPLAASLDHLAARSTSLADHLEQALAAFRQQARLPGEERAEASAALPRDLRHLRGPLAAHTGATTA